MQSNFEMDTEYVKNLIDLRYENGKYKGESIELYKLLHRGVGAVFDYVIAKDVESCLDSLVEKYGLQVELDLSLVPPPSLTFFMHADTKKTLNIINKKWDVPEYIKKNIHEFETSEPTKGIYRIFGIGDDVQIGKKDLVPLKYKLIIPIEDVLNEWDITIFAKHEKIKEYLTNSLEVLRRSPEGMKDKFGAFLTDSACELMNTEGIVKNTFGNSRWRESAIAYAKKLMDLVIENTKKKKRKNIEDQKEFLDKILALFSYYREKFI